MKPTNIVSFTIVLLFFYSTIFAREVPIETARVTAKNLYFERFNRVAEIDHKDIIIVEEVIFSEQTVPLFYIFNMHNNGGFVIISAEDNSYPVLGYSFTGSYSDIGQPPAFTQLLENYKQQISFIKRNHTPATSEIRSEWQFYSSVKNFLISSSIMNVSPLLNTTWDQGCNYNAHCPVNSNGPCGHVWAGCVATAYSQIMKYHNYPQQGKGNHSYNMPGYGTQSANFGNTTYNWATMPNSLNSYDSAVAELLYQCGVAVDMYYSPTGSGAMSYKVVDVLKDHFRYSESANMVYKSDYSNVAWENLLKNELNASRPVYYAGDDPSQGGHAFVCDGYQGSGDNHFHFNWGWSGYYNGYFYVSSLSPGSSNFSTNQEAIIGIKPVTGTCNGLSTLVANYGTIDDDSGIDDYENNANCQWLIQPSGAVAIILDFTTFDTEAGVDFVYVYDGADTTAPLLGVFSGSIIPAQLVSTGGSMMVHFVSNSSVTESGWSADYYNTIPPACSGLITHTDASGTIEDGSGNSDYGNLTDCQWLIQPEAGLSVTLTFNSFDTELGYDIVKVYNGTSSSDPLILMFSGSNIPPPKTSGGSMFITFTTDIYTTGAGWKATYTSTNNTGINEGSDLSSLVLYPNPNNGIVTLSLNNNYTGLVDIAIHDLTGKQMYKHKLIKSLIHFTKELCFEELPSGFYFITVTTDANSITERLIIE